MQPRRFNFWNPAKTVMFIREYERHELLWNPHHPHYRHVANKELAYDLIGRVLGKPVMSRRLVVNRIRYLRTRYNERRKLLAANSATVTPDWFIALDMFLGKIVNDRRSSAATRLADVSDDSHEQQQQQQQQQQQMQLPTQSFVVTETIENPTSSTSPSVTSPAERIVRQLTILQQLDESVQHSMQQLHSLVRDEAAAEAAKARSRSAEQTEFDAFGCNVAKQLGQLELNDALECQMAVQGVLRTFRLRQHHRQLQQFDTIQQQQIDQQNPAEPQTDAVNCSNDQQEQTFDTIREDEEEIGVTDNLADSDRDGLVGNLLVEAANQKPRYEQNRHTIQNDMMIVDIASDSDDDSDQPTIIG